MSKHINYLFIELNKVLKQISRGQKVISTI